MKPTNRITDIYPKLPQAFVLILLLALILQNTRLSTPVAYAAITFVYFIFLLIYSYNQEWYFFTRRSYFVVFLALLSVIFFRTIFDPTTGDLVRLFVLFSFTAINLFLLPRVVPFLDFLRITSRLAAILVLLGFIPFLGVGTTFGFVDVSFWGTFSESDINILTSVFTNPNHLGSITMVGVIAAFEEYQTTRSHVAKVLFTTNLIGLFLSHYRTGWIALIAVGGLFVVHTLGGREWTTIATISGLSFICIVLLMIFGVIPGPSALSETSLNNRRRLWTMSFHAFQERPIVGHGFTGTAELVGNPHNSYIRMFTAFGVIGGVLYIFFVLGTAISSVREAMTDTKFIIGALLVAFVIVQLMNQLTFIGISMRSSLIAISIGYYLSSRHPGYSTTPILNIRDRVTDY